MSNDVIIDAKDIYKTFIVGKQNVPVVRGISFQVKKSDFVIIFGPSGCGKSTMLHIMLGLEEPSKGKLSFLNKNYYSFNEDERSELRKKNVGMVYQQPNWIKSLNVVENVAFPLTLLGEPREKALKIALDKLKTMKMESWAEYYPAELSSGQQQKCSLARAITNDPSLIIADEPTGNLDSQSSLELMNLLTNLNKLKKTIVMVTHDLEYLKYASRVLHMLDGQVDREYRGGDKNHSIQKFIKKGAKGKANGLK